VNSEPTAAAAPAPQGVVEDWEGENTWQCNVGGEGSTLESAVDDHTTDQGIGALRITFKLVENAWSDCGTSFDSVRDWSSADGLTLALHASKAGQPLVVVLFSGDPNAYSPFVASVQTTAESMSGWTYPALPWSSFARADWADQGGPDKLDPSRIMGLAVNLTQGEGTIWLDTITLFAGQAQVTEEKAEPTEPIEEKEEPTAAPSSTEVPQAAPLPTGAPETAVAPEPATPARQRSSPCASAAAFPLALACVVLARKRR